MTALKQYERLESTGLWRANAQEQRREVYISFGDTSLVIRDKNDNPLSHWSLPAVERMNPGAEPAIFTPRTDAAETLEIEDATMIAAIETVRAAINRRRPHPGRLRAGILLGVCGVILALGLFWLPGAVRRHTVRIVPFETRQQIGAQVIRQITRLTGRVCSTPEANRALVNLDTRLGGDPRGQILVLADGIAQSAMLPGRIVLLNRRLVEEFEQPEVAASYVLLERLRAKTRDPLDRLLRQAGGFAAFQLLTTGRLDTASLTDYARSILTQAPLRADDQTLLAAFQKAGFSSAPLAYSIDMTGETTLPLIEADPFRNRTYKPLLSDADWIALQGICGG